MSFNRNLISEDDDNDEIEFNQVVRHRQTSNSSAELHDDAPFILNDDNGSYADDVLQLSDQHPLLSSSNAGLCAFNNF